MKTIFYFILLLSALCSHAETLSRKVSCDIMGGLGNQLFQIAATLSFAWDHGYDPGFLRVSSSPSRVSPRPVYWDTVFHRLNTYSSFNARDSVTWDYCSIEYKPIEVLGDAMTLRGYFESPRYFDHHRDQILDAFSLPEALEQYVDEKYRTLADEHEETVSVHIRRDDLVTAPLKWNICLWEESDRAYYDDALTLFPDAVVIVFCDDPQFAREFFQGRLEGRQVKYVHEEDYIELFLMTRCTHNIIANSTFSWWGAYLNKNPQKRVVIPRYHHYDHSEGVLGAEACRPELIMSGWIPVENNRVLPERRRNWPH